MDRLSKITRIILDGKPYLALRDSVVDGQMENGGFKRVLRRIILTERNEEAVSCIVFYSELLSSYIWRNKEQTLYGFGETLEFAFANLLPHLPLRIGHLKETFGHSSKCIKVEFTQDTDAFSEDYNTYNIQVKNSFLETAQRIVFNGDLSKKRIRQEILQVLLNSLEENPGTYMRIENLESSVPLLTKDFMFNLRFLKDEDEVDFITPPSDAQKIISVKIKPKGIRELDGISELPVQYPQMVKNVYGPNIESTTYGANSPITVNIDEIETIFEGFQKEIIDNPKIDDKEVLLSAVKELKTEIKERKIPNKVRELLGKIQRSTNFVYNKIICHPIISSIIADLMIRGAGVK